MLVQHPKYVIDMGCLLDWKAQSQNMMSKDSKETACFQGLWISQIGGVSRDLPAHADWSEENEPGPLNCAFFFKSRPQMCSRPVIDRMQSMPSVNPSST